MSESHLHIEMCACMIDRLGTGWSMHTTETGALTRSTPLTFEEQEHIMHVIRQAELLEHAEMQRVGSEIPFLLHVYEPKNHFTFWLIFD